MAVVGLGALVVLLSAVVIVLSSTRHTRPVSSSPTVTRATPTHRATSPTKASSGQSIDPSLFGAGSCVSFGPTSGDRHETVFIDAGHGGIDPGATGVTESDQTIYEADETLPVELDAMALLRAAGYGVVGSRTSDSTVARLGAGDVADGVLTAEGDFDDVAARDVCANMAKGRCPRGDLL